MRYTASSLPVIPPAKPQGHVTAGYRIALRGGTAVIPLGPPHADAFAELRIHSQDEMCWRFSGRRGFGKPTSADIHQGKAGALGPVLVLLSGRFSASGCQPLLAPALMKQIERRPSGYYLSIYTSRYPGGAVRGQL